MSYLTVPLDTQHKKKHFCCGNNLLDTYLHTQAKQDVKRKLAACFVLADEENNIKAYYTLSSASIARSVLPDDVKAKLPPSYYNLPTTLLGRLAVDEVHKGRGLGAAVLFDALKRAYDAVTSVGSMAVIVDPIDDAANLFYKKHGFILLPDNGKMAMSMDTIAKLF